MPAHSDRDHLDVNVFHSDQLLIHLPTIDEHEAILSEEDHTLDEVNT